MEETVRVYGRPELRHIKVLQKLLDIGADVNVQDFAGRGAYFFRYKMKKRVGDKNRVICFSGKSGSIFRDFWIRYIYILTRSGRVNFRVLILKAVAGSGEGIKKILNRVFVVLAGYTPLHHCLTCNGSIATLEMAKMLIQKGAEVNTVNRDGIMPFYIDIIVDIIIRIIY